MRILIITGMSGSGKSTAVRALEDEDFFCLDNMPVKLIPTFIELVEKSKEKVRDVALGMDIRGRDYLQGYEGILHRISLSGHQVEVIFFDATDEVLIRRFSETRRRHPIMGSGSVPEGIRLEREQLAGIRRLATTIIDTSELNVHQLKELVTAHIRGEFGSNELTLHIQSFGFRFGLPLDSDLVMDVRFLPNPHFVPELKPFSGLDPSVSKFVLDQPQTAIFMEKYLDLMEFLVSGYRKEGKSYLTVSIGCTGGKHRSVAIAEEVRRFFEEKNIPVKITHRDMEKG
jgi:UPF0042 nucleotide-binding protein